MGNIQHHIDWKQKQHDWAVKYNEMAQAGKSGNAELFADLVAKEYGDKGLGADYIKDRCEELMKNPLRDVPKLVPQVTLDQVKEKFGTLRFYYTGGDEYISGMVTMAEAMSGVICESCGNPGKQTSGGWIKTICQPCETEREERRAKEYAEYNARNNA
jgi:hypothetical protein